MLSLQQWWNIGQKGSRTGQRTTLLWDLHQSSWGFHPTIMKIISIMKVVIDMNDMAQIIMARIVTLDPVTKKMMIIPDQLSMPPCRHCSIILAGDWLLVLKIIYIWITIHIYNSKVAQMRRRCVIPSDVMEQEHSLPLSRRGTTRTTPNHF